MFFHRVRTSLLTGRLKSLQNDIRTFHDDVTEAENATRDALVVLAAELTAQSRIKLAVTQLRDLIPTE